MSLFYLWYEWITQLASLCGMLTPINGEGLGLNTS